MNSVQLIEAYFGTKLTAEQRKDWVSELMHPEGGVRGLTEEELCQSIRWASDPKNWEQKSKVTLKNVKTWVYLFRRQQRNGVFGYGDWDDSREAQLSRAKSKMLKAKTHEERWDIICDDVKGPHESQKLYDWAEEKWGLAFVVAVDKLKQWMADTLSEMVAGIGLDARAEVEEEDKTKPRVYAGATGPLVQYEGGVI